VSLITIFRIGLVLQSARSEFGTLSLGGLIWPYVILAQRTLIPYADHGLDLPCSTAFLSVSIDSVSINSGEYRLRHPNHDLPISTRPKGTEILRAP
jgi:hypothetical protein